MKSLAILAIAALASAGGGIAFVPSEQTVESFSIETTYQGKYLLDLPAGYDADGEKRWPLLVFLHGSGERGRDASRVARHGPPKVAKNDPDFPFVVVSPQCPRGQVWSPAVVLALLDEVVAKHAIDEDRVYLTGLSLGGYATWAVAAQAPRRFAAIAPVCGGGSGLDAWRADDIPVWAFHGVEDRTVPVEESRRMIDLVKRRGNKHAKLTEYDGVGHNAWDNAYADPKLWEWFLSHRR